jgi:hypothetical protein
VAARDCDQHDRCTEGTARVRHATG